MMTAVITVFDLLRRDLLAAAHAGGFLDKRYLFQAFLADQMPTGCHDIVADRAAARIEQGQ